jgi:putative glutathione S-transferase
MDVLDPYREERSWQFSPERAGCTPDTVNGADYLAEVYEAAAPGFEGKVSVPVLWDREHETIVNNESIEVMRMLASAFGEYQSADVDLYPAGQRDEIDRITDALYEPVNNGVYRAGFAASQAAYDAAVADVFDAFADLESLLADQRYLAGPSLTLADLRLFPTLVRFDEVYHTHFRCNRRRVEEYPNLWEYTRELYQLPGVAETVDMAHIKEHYYTTHDSLNPKRIVPVGPDPAFEAPHDRDRLPGGPPAALTG